MAIVTILYIVGILCAFGWAYKESRRTQEDWNRVHEQCQFRQACTHFDDALKKEK